MAGDLVSRMGAWFLIVTAVFVYKGIKGIIKMHKDKKFDKESEEYFKQKEEYFNKKIRGVY
jgi:hypothetical protein